jgi:hypothetical protein
MFGVLVDPDPGPCASDTRHLQVSCGLCLGFWWILISGHVLVTRGIYRYAVQQQQQQHRSCAHHKCRRRYAMGMQQQHMCFISAAAKTSACSSLGCTHQWGMCSKHLALFSQLSHRLWPPSCPSRLMHQSGYMYCFMWSGTILHPCCCRRCCCRCCCCCHCALYLQACAPSWLHGLVHVVCGNADPTGQPNLHAGFCICGAWLSCACAVSAELQAVCVVGSQAIQWFCCQELQVGFFSVVNLGRLQSLDNVQWMCLMDVEAAASLQLSTTV